MASMARCSSANKSDACVLSCAVPVPCATCTLCGACSVWYKHRDNLFLPAYAELSSMALVRAANTVYESVVFSSIV